MSEVQKLRIIVEYQEWTLHMLMALVLVLIMVQSAFLLQHWRCA